jgi:predicted O-methyltransferase YrrM
MKKADNIILQFTKDMNTMGDWEIMLKYSQNRKVLEIGTYAGLNAILLSRHAKHVTTVDNYSSSMADFKTTSRYLAAYGNIEAVNSRSDEYAKTIEDETFDTVFIDGDHHYCGVKADFENYQNKVKKGGVLIFHDTDELHDEVHSFIKDTLYPHKNDNPKFMFLKWKPKYDTICMAFERMY